MCVCRTVLLEAKYSSNPPGDSVLNSRTMKVKFARRDFWTNENPDPSKWNDVSSVWGLRVLTEDRETGRKKGSDRRIEKLIWEVSKMLLRTWKSAHFHNNLNTLKYCGWDQFVSSQV